MLNWTVTYYQNYSPMGDVLVIIIAFVLGILLYESYVKKDASFKVFIGLVLFLCAAAALSLSYNQLFLVRDRVPPILIYIFRLLYRYCLYWILYGFIRYDLEVMAFDKATKKSYIAKVDIILSASLVGELIVMVSGRGFYFDKYIVKEGFRFFLFAYGIFVGFIMYILVKYRHRMVKQIIYGIIMTFFVSVIMFVTQFIAGVNGYTTVAFLLPIISILYLMHSNPYDQSTGAVNEASFNSIVRDSLLKKSEYIIMGLHLYGFETEESFTNEMRMEVLNYGLGIVKRAMMFKVSGGRLLFVFPKDKNPDYKNAVEILSKKFAGMFDYFKIDFKAIFLITNEMLSMDNKYVEFISFVEKKTPMNSYYWVEEEDVAQYERRAYIISQLEDISRKKDLDDPRVLVYCQPVYNVEEKRYDTAEALMRLTLPDIGMVFPDQFISLAEKHGYIHDLSLIILNKTCRTVKELLSEGYVLNRVSVNFSMLELREPSFGKDITEVINKNGISTEMIAAEVTESKNLEDFELVKDRICELRKQGIIFYLDDFGTGYSNFERIMELPFDIIKFDRSLVMEAGKSVVSEYMIKTFADMFCNLEYHVLYEGVENEEDEERCIKMKAGYLQGYKYSKPIPIEMLKDFLERTEVLEDGE